jgi:LysR family cyn operon transcriptional activator
MSQDDLEIAVGEDKIDIGIAFSRQSIDENESTDIENYILFEEPLSLAVGNKHPHFSSEEMSVLNFGNESLALLNTNFALRRHINQYCVSYQVEPQISVETNSLSVIIEMVLLGKLATILPETVIRKNPHLHSISLIPKMPHKTVSLIWHKGRYKSPSCRAFIEIASDVSARMLQGELVD